MTEILSSRVLLLGPAGCGKSRRILDAFLEALAEGRGARTLLLVPTASYRDHMRNMALRDGRVRGFAGNSVGTFRDLLTRLAPGAGQDLTATRRELLVRRLLGTLKIPELRSVEGFPGFRAALAEAAGELRRAGLDPAALEPALGNQSRPAPFLKFFRAYDEAARDAGADLKGRLSAAMEAIAAGALPLDTLLVDGFADFTFEQRTLLAALCQRASSIAVALTLDRAHRGDASIFYQAERSRAWLAAAGFRETWMDGNYRAASPVLQEVERAIREDRGDPLPPLLARKGSLFTMAGGDRRDEAELMGREILRLVRDSPGALRYRDVGIIVRQPALYAPLLRDVFRGLGLPLRSFVPVPLGETAAGRHFRLCLDLFDPTQMPGALFRWLKMPYSGMRSRFRVEAFEYEAVARYAEVRFGQWDGCVPRDHFLAGVVRRLRAHELDLHNARTLDALARWALRMWSDFREVRDLAVAESPEQALELRADAAAFVRIAALLEEMAEAGAAEGSPPASFDDFRSLALDLIGGDQLPVRDRRQDAVNLMSVFEARQWELRVVFVAGLLEKEFPAPAGEALFLGDSERAQIEKAAGVFLPRTAHRSLDEQLLFYLAATRARERLYLTWAQSDASGRPLLRSFFLRPLEPLLTGEVSEGLVRKRSDVVAPLAIAAGEADLLAACHLELGARGISRPALDRGVALYERLRPAGATRRAVRALRPPVVRLSGAALELLRKTAVQFSASAFRTFGDCAYKHFADRLLERPLGPADPETMDALRQGGVAHAAVERWARAGGQRPIAEILDEVFRTTMNEEGIPPGHLSVKAQAEMRRFLEQFEEVERARADVYRTAIDPEMIEVFFGGEKGLPALELDLADGTVVRITGRLDRVEVVDDGKRRLGLVLDFKYSTTGFERSAWERRAGAESLEATDLQLPVYLIAMKEGMGLVPAGAELCALKERPPRRLGIYDVALLPRIFAGEPPSGGLPLPAGRIEALMERAREAMKQAATRIREGHIQAWPANPDLCGKCNFFDVCRVNLWEVRRAREARQAN